MSADQLPKFMLPAEAIEALGGPEKCSLRTLQRMARAKQIPGTIYIGRKLYFQRIPFTAWVEGGSTAEVFAFNARRVG